MIYVCFVVKIENIIVAISRFSISYSRYYMRTYCVWGQYWVWEYEDGTGSGTASQNSAQ